MFDDQAKAITAWLGSSSDSSDIVSPDFHLFWPLQNPLNIKNCKYLEDYKRHLEQLFAQTFKKFWGYRIMKMHEKWQKVVEQNCEYVLQ